MSEILKQPDLSQKTESPQKVVRAFVVSLANSDEVLQSLKNGENFSCLRFYLGVKGEADENKDENERKPKFKSKKRLTFFGGKINELENFGEAVQKEISEELSIAGLGLPRFTEIGTWQYKIGDYEREVILTYVPASYLPEDKIIIGDKRISHFKTLTLSQLKQTIEEGRLDGLPLEEHLAMIADSSDTFSISEEDKNRRNQSLKKGLLWMEHIENYLRIKIEKLIELCKDKNDNFDEEKFKKEYEKLRSYFMRRGLEVNKKGRNEKKEGETFKEKHPLVEVLTSGFLGKEILYYLPELAINGVDWPGLEEAPEGVRIFVEFFKEIVEDFLTSHEIKDLQEYKRLMLSEEMPIDKKKELINDLDRLIKERLKSAFGATDENIMSAFNWLDNFFRDLSNELKVADSHLIEGLHQDFVLINEVKNANLGYLVSLFFGLDVKDNKDFIIPIRFEAGRSLLLFMKALSVIDYYQKSIEQIRDGVTQYLMNSFFGSLVEEVEVDVGEGQKLRVRIRKRNDGKKFIVDEKPIKSPTSFLRKCFEEASCDIKDFYTISVVMLDGNGNAETLISELENYLKNNGIEYRISDKKDYGTGNFKNGEKTKIDGKRVGSQGSRFVRTKFILELSTELGKKEMVEIIIYPHFSISDGYHWGWLETRKDDKNYVVRRVLAGEKGIPSFYDLLFPPVLYPRHFEHKLSSTYHK